MNLKILDGALGTTLIAQGFKPPFERLNITHPEVIKKIHSDYINAGSEILLTHTFAAKTLEEIEAAWNNIKDFPQEKFASIGPQANTELLVEYFRNKARIVFETIYDVKTALKLIADYQHLNPIFSFCLRPSELKVVLDEMDKYVLSTVGLNCLNGFEEAQTLLSLIPSKYEIYFKPNSGKESISPHDFAIQMSELQQSFKLSFIGGCCGTTPSHIQKVQKVRRTFWP